MMQTRWLAAFLIVVTTAAELPAQISLGGGPAGGPKRGRVTFTVSGTSGYPLSFTVPVYRRVTVYYYGPSGTGTPLGGSGLPTVPAEREEVDDQLPKMPPPRKPPEPAPAPKPEAAPDKPEPPLPGVPASVFRPVGPDNRTRALLPGRLELPPPPEPPAPVPPSEQARLTALGKEAFAAGEYGLAERRFRKATAIAPDEASPYFLEAQAQFAQGKYQEAVAKIHDGLRRAPDWPKAAFRPRDLDRAEAPEFVNQLTHLREILRQHPKDPVLLFLLAYQLWFDGQQEEARTWFQQAAVVTPDQTGINRFLR